MRAGRLDVLVETGARWVRDVQLVAPGAPVAVETATAGQRYYLDGVPRHVVGVTDNGNGWTTLQLGDGLYDDPTYSIRTGALVAPAVPVAALEAAAAFSADPVPTPLDAVEIPSSISPDGATVTLSLTADVTAAMPAGAYSWDLYVRTAEWDWQRAIEGTFTIVKGDAR